MYKMLKEARADIMLSGGRSQFIALKAKMPWLDINQERHHAYAGYEGMVELVEEIDKALYNPVWAQVRLPAPWEETSWEERATKALEAEAAALAADPERAEEARRAKKFADATMSILARSKTRSTRTDLEASRPSAARPARELVAAAAKGKSPRF